MLDEKAVELSFSTDRDALHGRMKTLSMNVARAFELTALAVAVFDLEPRDVERLIEAAPLLETLGLVLDSFGPGAVLVRETPASLGNVDATPLLRDLADDEAATVPLDRRLDHYLATFACQHSIRAASGQSNHDRPAYVELKLADIERLFGRWYGQDGDGNMVAGQTLSSAGGGAPKPQDMDIDVAGKYGFVRSKRD